ncbi:MAG: cupin domain-containing protein [Bacteroidetes bacterium]|nr:MAG: cupin domain-containing protein [Bacteroidota bacterium]
MKIINISETLIKKTPHKIESKLLYDNSSAQATHIKLQAGESLKPHITPVDVFFYILEGTPEIMVGEDKQIVHPDCLVESPKDIPHCIYNNSDKIVRVLVVKAPKPTSKTIFLK